MTITSKYYGTCQSCGMRFAPGAIINWTRGSGVYHANMADCVAAKAVVAVQAELAPKIDLSPVIAFLSAAKARGLKFPKLRVLSVDGKRELRLSLTVKGMEPGSVCVMDGGEFVGCVRPNGLTTRRLKDDEALRGHLLQVAADPAAAAKAYAALMCKCSFCNLPLTDAGSVEVGYGPVCASHWGLPHSPKGTPSLVCAA